MRLADKPFKKLVLVCTNERTDGRECCAQKGSLDLYFKLKTAVASVDPTIRVSRCGCLDNCQTGITVVLMPMNIWLARVSERDIEEIIKLICTSEK